MMSHKIWRDFERGKFSLSVCYDRLAEAFCIPSSQDVSDVFDDARATAEADESITELIKDISSDFLLEGTKLYIMSNMSREDWVYVQGLDVPWDLFDREFVSGHAGMRKPDLRFFELVLKEINMQENPEDVLFIDDKFENVQAAEQLGICGVQFKSGTETSEVVRKLLGMRS